MYRISFFKTLLSSSGMPFHCLQDTIDIGTADSPEEAARAAQRQFEQSHRISDWKLLADFIGVQTTNASRAVPRRLKPSFSRRIASHSEPAGEDLPRRSAPGSGWK